MSLQKLAAQFGFNVDAKSVDAAINSVGSIDREINRVSRGVTKFMGLLGAGGIGAGIYTFAKSAVDEFAKEQQEVNILNNALGTLGITNRQVTEDLIEFAKAQSKVSMATDEEIVAAERSLVQFGLWGDQLKEAVKDSLNLSTKTGDLASAADMVGKAFQGVTKGLSSVGIQIDENIPKAKVFAEVHRQINEHFSGAAAAQMGGYAGQMHVLTIETDEYKKKIGEQLLPVFKFWVELLNEILEKTDKIVSGKSMAVDGSNYISALPVLQKSYDALLISAASYDRYNKEVPKDLQAQIERYSKLIEQTKQFEAARAKTGGAGRSVPTNPTVPANVQISMPDEAREIDTATEAWRRGNEAMEEYYTQWLGHNVEFIAAIRPTEELRAKVNSETWKKITSEWKSAEQQNKATVENMKTAWEQGSHSVTGGWTQALLMMQQSASNWRNNWLQVMNGSVGPAKTAFHDFFNSTSKDFLNLESLAKKMFQGILNAFLDMLETMAAKAAIYGIFSMAGGGGSIAGLKSFLGFSSGGYTGDGDPNDVAGFVHKGEYVLDADTTNKIRTGAPVGNGSAFAAGAKNSVNITQNITLNGASSTEDIGKLCEKLTEATREGLRQAGEMANVITKIGTQKAGITGL